jgi:iron complex outermembrane recepter protein
MSPGLRYFRVAKFGLLVLCILLSQRATPRAVAQSDSKATLAPSDGDAAKPTSGTDNLDALLDMADKDPARLSNLKVDPVSSDVGKFEDASNTMNKAEIEAAKATSTGDLLKRIPDVSGRRLSGINIDPRVRGFNSSQLNANANGMTQRKSIQDIDSLFSQIDPGVIQEIAVLDGPYTSLYGPGFAFISVDLMTPKRYDRPEMHTGTTFNYGSNGQNMYGREYIWGGSKDWGVLASYGVRTSNDYHAGGADSDWLVPSSFQKWDTLLSVSYDISSISRIEVDMLHTDLNNVEMAGIVYDLDNSANNQYNVRYIIQTDRDGPQQFLMQAWHQETFFRGDASRFAKQQSFYQAFIADTGEQDGNARPVNTLGSGYSISTGLRGLLTFGEADNPQWTLGADYRRFGQRYLERDIDALGVDVYDGNLFGIPESRTDDVGVLTNLFVPVNDRFAMTVGGRFDYAQASLNANDPIITQFNPGVEPYYEPGIETPNYSLGMAYTKADWALNEHDTLSVGTGFAMRAPDLAELYSDEPFVPLIRFGNSYTEGFSSMRPEKNWQFDLGISSKRGPFRYGARGFYATIWDYIAQIPYYIGAPLNSTHYLGRNFQDFTPEWRSDLGLQSENGDTCQTNFRTFNIGLATMSGGDLFGEVEVRKGVSVFGCMSYVHGENLRPLHVTVDSAGNNVVTPIEGTEPLPGIYPFNGRLAFRVFDPEKDRWGVEFCARFVHSQEEVAASLSELASPGFSVYDLRGYYRLRETIRLSLALENLLNRDYFEPGSLVILNPAGYPTFIREPGFTAILGIDGRF